MKLIAKVLPATLVLTLPLLAFAAAPTTLKDLVSQLVTLLNQATTVLVALALVVFLFGAAYNLLKAGERGSGALREFLVWGVIILFVMVSIWGILNLLQDTLFGAGGGTRPGSQTSSVQ